MTECCSTYGRGVRYRHPQRVIDTLKLLKKNTSMNLRLPFYLTRITFNQIKATFLKDLKIYISLSGRLNSIGCNRPTHSPTHHNNNRGIPAHLP